MRLVGLREIADICGVSSSSVANWRVREPSFPKPMQEIKAGPIFDLYEIEQWMLQKGKDTSGIISLKKKGGDENMLTKKICIVGRSRVGKSRLVSRFLKYARLARRQLESSGKDFTKLNFKFYLTKGLEKKSFMRYLAADSTLNGIEVPFNDEHEDEIKNFLKRIEKENTYSQKAESELAGKPRQLNLLTDIIEIVTEASSFAREIMGNSIDCLIITDTPGVSGNVPLNVANDADVYLLMMKDDNDKEFHESIEKIIPKIAGSNVLFIYRNGNTYTTLEGYNEVLRQVKAAVEDFTDDLSKLVGNSVLNTSLEVLNPSGKVIPMGAFDIVTLNYVEECFNKDLYDKLNTIFSTKKGVNEEQVIIDSLIECSKPNAAVDYRTSDVINYFDKVVKEFILPNIGANWKANFSTEGHDRVKTKDNYRIEYFADLNCNSVLDNLYNLYKVMKYDSSYNVPKIVQEAVIKLVYLKLTESLKFDCGIFAGGHPFEDSTCKTMFVEEAIFADELLNKDTAPNLTVSDYFDVMRANGISSATWDWVYKKSPYIGEYAYCNTKLDVIQHCGLNNLQSNNTQQLIYNSYTMGLFKLGQYNLYSFLLRNLSVNDVSDKHTAMSWL
ncbi:helix-turn-helix transcriptional regulator [Paenibacillus sp. sgz500992]|uniref:helix-turn-helix transcriptional regulator n=1 Tax=Paenibacillus sp. sgz500992 TaxID=3242476 RepID=UPI0036D275A7